MPNKVDYNPNFDRDPKEQLGIYRAELTKKSIENATLNPTVRTEEPTIKAPDQIRNMEDFARSVDDLSDKLEAVSTRAAELEEILKFDPIPVPENLKQAVSQLGHDPDEGFTPAIANCCVKVLNYSGTKGSNINIEDGTEEIEKLEKELFPEWGIKFILILFFMFLKGITWQIFATLCRSFRKIKLKIGPFKPCIGCPFAKIFKAFVKVINSGKDYKIDNKGNAVLDENGNIQKWGSCPPDFDPYGFETTNAVSNSELGNGENNTDQPTSVCSLDRAPTSYESDSAKKLVGHYVAEGTRNPTENNLKASQYIQNKTIATQYNNNISNTLVNTANANDPKEQVFTVDTSSTINNSTKKVQTDVEKAIAEYDPQKLIDEGTKAILQLINGMLKVWDGLISAINKTATLNSINRDMICCFLNIFGIIFPDFRLNSSVSIQKMEAVVDLATTLIDIELDELALNVEFEYFELSALSNALEDAILYSMYATLSPVVNKMFQEIKEKFDPQSLITKAIDRFNDAATTQVSTDDIPRPKIVDAIENCILFKSFSATIGHKIEDMQLKVTEWFIGFKGKSDIQTKKLVANIQLSSRAKLLFSLKTILKGTIESIKKDVNIVMSICSDDGNVSPVTVQTIEDTIDSNIYTNPSESQISDPIYGPDEKAGILDNDIVDEIFTEGEFYEPTYDNMPGYSTTYDPYGTIYNRSDALHEDGIGSDQPASPNAQDQSTRDCKDKQYLQELAAETSSLFEGINTLFDI